MKQYLLAFFFCIITFLSNSQDFVCSGKIIDAQTNEPLPFVNVTFGAKNQGVTTDVNGKFRIKCSLKPDTLFCSFVGYEPKTYVLGKNENLQSLTLELRKKVFDLNEFVLLPTENPADRIIHAAVSNRDKNNPLKNSSFSYTSYNKMVFTSNVLQDTIAMRIAADTTQQDSISKMMRRTVAFFKEQHIFMMESVNKRIFKAPDKNYEKIVASKVSGFKDPIFSILITQVQAISFYDDMFMLLDKKYVNPISSGSTTKYFFEIQDTTYRNQDTVFIISYRPMRGKVFDGLKGVLYINSNGYAIQNVIAEPAKKGKGFNISIQQQYELVDNEKWFPTQLNTNFFFNSVEANGYKILGIGTSYIQDIKLNNAIKNSAFGDVELDLDVESEANSEQVLIAHRREPLTPQEIKTYTVIDSIGKKEHFEKFLNRAKVIMTGRIPYKIFEFDVANFVRYNEYEGWRLQLGLYTGSKLSRHFSLGGYYAYGFCDEQHKYRLEGLWNINRMKDTKLSVAYQDDIEESGVQSFYFEPKMMLDGNYLRRYFVTRFDRSEKFEAAISHRFFRYLTTRLEFNTQTRSPMFQDVSSTATSEENALFNSKAHLTEGVLSLKYAYKEKFVKNGDWVFSMGTDYPMVFAQYTHGFSNLLNSDFEYNKLELKIVKSFQFKYAGKLTVQIAAGASDATLPLWGSFVAKSCFNRYGLFGDNAFQSIRINAFVSDQYTALFLKHNFGKSKFQYKQFKPELSLHHNLLFGGLAKNGYLTNFNYKTPEFGYFEVGAMVNKILDLPTMSIGAGVFYNYGHYADLNEKKNFTFLWSFALPLE
jgi:hypothetical protein